jgi:hypothetical protein
LVFYNTTTILSSTRRHEKPRRYKIIIAVLYTLSPSPGNANRLAELVRLATACDTQIAITTVRASESVYDIDIAVRSNVTHEAQGKQPGAPVRQPFQPQNFGVDYRKSFLSIEKRKEKDLFSTVGLRIIRPRLISKTSLFHHGSSYYHNHPTEHLGRTKKDKIGF